MKELFDKVSYQCSKSITQTYSTSFALSVRLLSPKIQGAIHGVYGFVRLADEIVDSFHLYNRESLFKKLEQDLEHALKKKISINPVLHTFQEVVYTYNIDRDLINAFMDSMRSDLYPTNYKTMTEYIQYIYGSADVVGLMCLKIFVNGNQELYDKLKYPAMKLGSAFQKVNFLRDYKEDTQELHRNYFPHLQGDILATSNKDAIIKEIEEDFSEAFTGIKQLPIEAKFGVYTAYIYYKSLLRKLKKVKVEELRKKRVRISNPVKMGLLAKSFINYKLNIL